MYPQLTDENDNSESFHEELLVEMTRNITLHDCVDGAKDDDTTESSTNDVDDDDSTIASIYDVDDDDDDVWGRWCDGSDTIVSDDDDDDDTTSHTFGSRPSQLTVVNDPQLSKATTSKNRKVQFGMVQIREYSVTVGAYASTDDSCPLQLSWEHKEFDLCRTVAMHQQHHRNIPPSLPRRLTIQERRERIARVQGITTADVIQQLEYETALCMIQETIRSIAAAEECIEIHDCDSLSSTWGRKAVVATTDNLFRKIMLYEIPPLPIL